VLENEGIDEAKLGYKLSRGEITSDDCQLLVDRNHRKI